MFLSCCSKSTLRVNAMKHLDPSLRSHVAKHTYGECALEQDMDKKPLTRKVGQGFEPVGFFL